MWREGAVVVVVVVLVVGGCQGGGEPKELEWEDREIERGK